MESTNYGSVKARNQKKQYRKPWSPQSNKKKYGKIVEDDIRNVYNNESWKFGGDCHQVYSYLKVSSQEGKNAKMKTICYTKDDAWAIYHQKGTWGDNRDVE